MMAEIWKDIEGFEGTYEVSSLGNIRRTYKNGNVKILHPITLKKGYTSVRLSKCGVSKNYAIHRLVANAFIPNPDNLPCVNHIDECTHNNVVDNLEWCTYKYNNDYGSRKEKAAMARINGKCSKRVYQYDLEDNYITDFPSLAEAKRTLGYDAGHISDCCLGKRKTAYGYKWSYNNNNNK